MYLELSRPDGDVSRWEKVLKRLSLFNKHYPLRGKNCSIEDIQRLFEYGIKKTIMIGNIASPRACPKDALLRACPRSFENQRDIAVIAI